MINDVEYNDKNIRRKHKKGRLIIRNLSFKVTDDTLNEEFSKFGNIIDIKIPTKPDGKMRGFAFVEFEKTASAIKAINALNAKEILGRPVAIDFALAKDRYRKLMKQKYQTNTNFEVEKEKLSLEEEKEKKSNKHFKKKQKPVKKTYEESQSDSTEEEEENEDESEIESESLDENKSDDSEDESSEDDENSDDDENSVVKDDDESPPKKKMKTGKPRRPNDAHEGKTLFIRNLSFDTTADSLKEAMLEFGQIKYCLLCIDKLTDYPKGTAFVQFINKEDAEKCLTQISQPDKSIVLDGRRLNVSLAISPEDIQKNKEEKQKKGKDNRNLKLLSEGLIRAGSDSSKGVSQADLKKRLELETYKKRLLKNFHYFISPVRLCIHNLPPNVDDKKLNKIFSKAAGPQAKVISAKVMRNLKNLDENGVGISKGFGFVGFTRHEDALQALRNLNNNPGIFTPNKRPIVEFSVENRQILNAKKRQVERQQGKARFFSSNKKESTTNFNANRIKVQKKTKSKAKDKGKLNMHKEKPKKGKKNFKQVRMVY